MVAPIRSSDVHKPLSHNTQKPRSASEGWKKPDPRPLPPVKIQPSAVVVPPTPVQGKYDGTKPMPPVHIKFDLSSEQNFFKIPKPVAEEKKGEGLFVGPPIVVDSEKEKTKPDPIIKPHCIKVPKPINEEKKDEVLFVGPPIMSDKKWPRCSSVDLYYPAQDLAYPAQDLHNASSLSTSAEKHSKMREKKELAAA